MAVRACVFMVFHESVIVSTLVPCTVKPLGSLDSDGCGVHYPSYQFEHSEILSTVVSFWFHHFHFNRFFALIQRLSDSWIFSRKNVPLFFWYLTFCRFSEVLQFLHDASAHALSVGLRNACICSCFRWLSIKICFLDHAKCRSALIFHLKQFLWSCGSGVHIAYVCLCTT